MTEGQDRSERGRQRLLWLVIGAVIVLVVNQFGVAVIDLFNDPESRVAAAKERIKGEAAASGRYVAEERTIESNDSAAWLVVLRHRSVGNYSVEVPPVSDEVRIYDVVDDRLRLDLRFHPGPETGRPNLSPPEALPFLFAVRLIEDFDEDGEPEVLGAFYSLFMEPALPRPVLLSKAGQASYGIEPLTDAFSPGPPRSSQGAYARNERDYYKWVFMFRDGRSKAAFRARPVAEFAYVPEDSILITAVVARARSHADRPLLELRAERLVSVNGNAIFYPCSIPGGSEFLPPTPNIHAFPAAIVRHWRQVSAAVDLEKVCA